MIPIFSRVWLYTFFIFLMSAAAFGSQPHNPSDALHEQHLQNKNSEFTNVVIGTDVILPPFRIPFDFRTRSSLAQTLYFAQEIQLGAGEIHTISYEYSFTQEVSDKQIKVWIGETHATHINDGWFDTDDMMMVFEGSVSFQQGQHVLTLDLQHPYTYQGGNLVIQTYRVYETSSYHLNDKFYCTEDPGSERTRRWSSDGNINPENPSQAGLVNSWMPNTTLSFSLSGMGSLEGTVTSNDQPVEGVQVVIPDSYFSTNTDENGNFAFPNLLPGIYDLEFSKFGYASHMEENVLVIEQQTTTLSIPLQLYEQYTVVGTVRGNDDVDLEGALVRLQGYDNYEVTTLTDGSFIIEDVFEGTYHFTIEFDGYEPWQQELIVNDDMDLQVLELIEIIHPPAAVSIDVENHGDSNAMLSWMVFNEQEFRYDDGTITSQLGSQTGTINTVLGAAHRRKAVLSQMSWFLTDNGGPHNIIKVWVFGLDENGQPDHENILYEMGGVSNDDGQWNTYEFTGPVHAPNGFLVGLSFSGFLGLAIDSGTDADWPFQPNSNFFAGNITNAGFTPIEELGDFNRNFLIRAFGIDGGETEYNGKALTSHLPQQKELLMGNIHPPVQVGSPASISGKNKALEGFNVFLDQTLVAEGISETEFLFEGLEEGIYTAGVQSVYTTGLSDIVTIDFDIASETDATFFVTTNSGDSPLAAELIITNQNFPRYTYSGTVPSSGQLVLEDVRKGTYSVKVTLEGFHDFQSENLQIDDDFSYSLELEEVIRDPFGLEVVLEGMEPGEALFKWNQIEGWFESFEEGYFTAGWEQIITNSGTGNVGDFTWHVTSVVSMGDGSIVPKHGNYQAFMMWDTNHQDEWLISPAFMAPDDDLVFWYYGLDGSPHGDNYFVKISINDGQDWTTLWNASDLPEKQNHYETPAVISLSEYAGQEVRLAWNNVDGDGQGLWYVWAIDKITVGEVEMDLRKFTSASGNTSIHEPGARISRDGIARSNTGRATELSPKSNRAFTGYNVFLNGEVMGQNVAAEEFAFTGLGDGIYEAGVQAVYTSGVSDVITIEFTIVDGVESYQVEFAVEDPEGNSLDQAVITLGDRENTAGDYVFNHVVPGIYPFEIIRDGYMTSTGELEVKDSDLHLQVTLIPDDTYARESAHPGVFLYPVPASSSLNISVSDVMVELIEIMDMMGRVVYSVSGTSGHHVVPLAGFENGIYLVRIHTSEQVLVRKIQVQR